MGAVMELIPRITSLFIEGLRPISDATRELEYYLNGETMKPEIRYKGKVYTSTNVLGTSDCWKTQARGTGGKWYTPQKYGEVRLRMEYKKGVLCVYINDLLDQRIDFD